MRLFYFTEGELTNFGDDLNRWMWEQLLPGQWNHDFDHGFAGIGTLISRDILPEAKCWTVFSSGVGYAPPPEDFGGDRWRLVALRGPLTCRVLNQPSSLGITDGAALLSVLPQCQPCPQEKRHGIVFMPHYESLRVGPWKEVCSLAGFEFLDPHADSTETVERIRTAKLVIADAMHAAIVADTLRVPWIPVTTSPQINTFKWLDWTLSLGLEYKPTVLPPSSPVERIRNRTLGLYGQHFHLPDATADQAMKHYALARRRKEQWWWKPYAKRSRQLSSALPREILRSAALREWTRRRERQDVQHAAEALHQVAEHTPYLSEERQFFTQRDRLMERLPLIA